MKILSAIFLVAALAARLHAADVPMPILKVAPGFALERVHVVPRETQGSLVSLCADPRGVLYASDQYGPLYRIEAPTQRGGTGNVREVKLPIGGAHGLTWIGKDLYAVVGQRDVCTPGLYRLRDTHGAGELDEGKLLRALSGDGEHAPHAVVAATPAAKTSGFTLPAGRGFVKAWTLDELTALAEAAKTPGRIEQGRRWFAAIGCAACHTFAGEGGALGPDLTAVAGRLGSRDLLEAIVDPSKEISDQYGSSVRTKRDGTQLNGRICNHSEGTVQVLENLFDPSAISKVKERDVLSIGPSKVSLMPAGMLDVLQAGEILYLLAFLKSGRQHP